MSDAPTATLVVEPDPGGHRFQAVAAVADLARSFGPVVLLTSAEGRVSPALEVFLGEQVRRGDLTVVDAFDHIHPPTRQMATEVASRCRSGVEGVPVGRAVVMDADQALKRWWAVAPRLMRGLEVRPRIVFMLTRYPARLALTDLTGWRLRGPKAVLAVLGMATGSLHRTVGFSGRDDAATGWIVKRVRDPHYCSAHSRDRAQHRAALGLPADRPLVGIFGAVDARKNPQLVLEAIDAAGLDATLVVAGGFDDEVRAWAAGLDQADRERVFLRDEFLDNDVLDRFVASVDVVPLALTNNGPSGIMGKAQAAAVPVVTAGSRVRAREVEATGTGIACDFTAASIGDAMRRAIGGEVGPVGTPLGEVTADEFAMTLLGVDADGRPFDRRRAMAGGRR
ncbi:glycosyltransferase [Aeromicrobium endophyticum]|nr:glycosyltransferase family 4 protein [Aeromicrobium endophyticum]